MPTGPAARMGDMHMCPMVTPGVPPIPHVGGPITLGMPTVLIGNMPAATLGSMCTCVGPPDTIILGSMGVLIGNKPAARMGDMCAHGGMIAVGCPTVIIGEMSPGGPNPVAVAVAIITSMLQQVNLDDELGDVDAIKLHTAAAMAAAETGEAYLPVLDGPLGNIVDTLKRIFKIGQEPPEQPELGPEYPIWMLLPPEHPERMAREVNPNDGKVNCSHIIDSVIARLKGTDVNARTETTGMDGGIRAVLARYDTVRSDKAGFAEIFQDVSLAGHGATQLVFMERVGQIGHVVVITNHHGVPMLIEGQGGGQVLRTAEEAEWWYSSTVKLSTAPINMDQP